MVPNARRLAPSHAGPSSAQPVDHGRDLQRAGGRNASNPARLRHRASCCDEPTALMTARQPSASGRARHRHGRGQPARGDGRVDHSLAVAPERVGTRPHASPGSHRSGAALRTRSATCSVLTSRDPSGPARWVTRLRMRETRQQKRPCSRCACRSLLPASETVLHLLVTGAG